MAAIDVDRIIPDAAKDDLKEVVSLLGLAKDNVIDLVKESRNLRFNNTNDNSLLGATKTADDYKRKMDELGISLQEYNKMLNQLAIKQAQLNASQSDAAKSLAALKVTQQDRNQALTQEAKLQQAANNSIDEARAKVALLTKERNGLNLATQEGIARQQALNAEIDKNNAFIKANVDQYQQQKINIGNYSGALTVLETELQRVRQILDQNNQSGEQHIATIIQLQKEEALLTSLIENQAAGFASATGELRNNQNALMAMQAAGLENTVVFRELLAETAKLKDNVSDLRGEIKHLASDTHVLDGLVGTAQALAGAWGIGVASAQLFGLENEDLQKSMVKLQAVTTILTGLQQIQNAVQKESSVMLLLNEIRTKAVTAAQWLWNYATNATTASTLALRSALISTGLGAILVLISSTAAAMEKWSEATDDQAEAQEKLNEQLKIQKEFQNGIVEGYKQQSDEIIAQMEAEGATSAAVRKQKEEDAKAVVAIQKDGLDEAIANMANYAETEKKLAAKSKDISNDEAKAYNDALKIKNDAAKAYGDAQHDLVMLQNNNQKAANEEQKEATKKAAEEQKKRTDAAKKAADDRKKIADEEYKAQFDAQKAEIDFQAQAQRDIADDDTASFDDRIDAVGKYYTQKIQLAIDDADFQKTQGKKTATELKAIDQQLAADIRQINLSAQKDYNALLTQEFNAEKDKNDKIKENLKSMTDYAIEQNNKRQKSEKDLTAQVTREWIEVANAAVQAAAEVAQNVYEKQIQQQDDLITGLEAQKQKQIDLTNTEVTSQDEKTRKIAQINLDYQRQEDILTAKKHDLQRKEAAFEKAASIASIIAKTSEAIMAALKIPVYGEALAIANGAVGAIQLAKVISTPVPQYAIGTPAGGHPGGVALFGEAGPEIVKGDGPDYLVNRPTLASLPKGAEVIPLNNSYMLPALRQKNESNQLSYAFDKHTKQVLEGLKKVATTIERQPVPSFKVVGNQWGSYLNNKL